MNIIYQEYRTYKIRYIADFSSYDNLCHPFVVIKWLPVGTYWGTYKLYQNITALKM